MDGSTKVNHGSDKSCSSLLKQQRTGLQTENSRCEVSRCCGGFGGVRVQGGSPDSTFVTKKRADPVPCVSLAQHGLAICQKNADLHLYVCQLTGISLFMVTSRCEADEAIGRKTSGDPTLLSPLQALMRK